MFDAADALGPRHGGAGARLFNQQYEDLEKHVPNLTREVVLPGKGQRAGPANAASGG